METKPNRSGVKSVETTLDVLAVIHRRNGATIEGIADEIGVGTSTVHRHLVTLRERGYVVAEGSTYRIGLQYLTYAGRLRRQLPANELIEQKVRQLRMETGERVQFIVEEQGERVYAFTEAGPNAVKTDAMIGKRGPLHVSAAGKAILAHWSEQRRDELLSRCLGSKNTTNTITDRDEFETELADVRERGYAFNDEESTGGLRAVGVPVLHDDGDVIGAISISGPANRLKGDYFREELPDLLLGTVNEIELNLRYS